MTTLNFARDAVYERFLANFTGVAASRIAFENEDFDEPETGDWVRLSVKHMPRTQDTLGGLGNRKFLSHAVVFVQVYTGTNTGVKQGDTLATEARDIFEAVSFSGLDFLAGDVREVGPDGRWFIHLAEVPFSYEEIK